MINWFRKVKIPYNRYFLVPFLLWMLAGGVLLALLTKVQLFHAINTHHNNITDTLMYRATLMGQPEVIIPVMLLVMALPRYRNRWFILTACLCNITPLIIARLAKSYFDAPRPISYFQHAPWIHVSPDWPVLLQFSFPSGHSEGAFSFFCFLSLILQPDHKGYGLLFFLLALLVGYSRVYLAAHFFADVYAGSIIGTASCLAMYAFMDKYKWRFTGEKDTFA